MQAKPKPKAKPTPVIFGDGDYPPLPAEFFGPVPEGLAIGMPQTKPKRLARAPPVTAKAQGTMPFDDDTFADSDSSNSPVKTPVKKLQMILKRRSTVELEAPLKQPIVWTKPADDYDTYKNESRQLFLAEAFSGFYAPKAADISEVDIDAQDLR